MNDLLQAVPEFAGVDSPAKLRALALPWLRRFAATQPRNSEEALAFALKQNALKRRRTNQKGEILPGMFNDQKNADMRIGILEDLAKQVDADFARECSWLLASTGYVPSPCGVPGTVVTQNPTPAIRRAVGCIRWFAARHYRDRDSEYNFSVPKKSTMAFPHYLTGDEGLKLRAAYFMSYFCFQDEILELADKEDWVALAKPGKFGRLPMHLMMSINYRVQPSQALELSFQGGKLLNATFKKRPVKDATGAVRFMDMSCPLRGGVVSMRGRSINQITGTTGQFLGWREMGYRKPYYRSCPVFKVPDIPARVRDCFAQFADVEDREFTSWDFGGMEKSQDSYVYEKGNVAGWRDAGLPAPIINLKRAIHYSPYLLTDDDPKRDHVLPVQLKGRLATPDVLNDLGKRSGEDDTDDSNKDVGCGIYNTGVFEVGGYGPLAKNHRTVESFMEEFGDRYVLQAKRVPGAKYMICGNAGDDCLMLGSHKITLALQEWFKGLAPQFDIGLEKDVQFLGYTVKNDGTSYPYPGKFFSNKLSPERFYTSPMRRDNWPLGIYGWLQHHSNSPYYPLMRRILDQRTVEAYGVTVEQLANSFAAKGMASINLNMADMLFLNDPTTLQWGRVSEDELSSDVLSSSDYYLNIPCWMTAQLR